MLSGIKLLKQLKMIKNKLLEIDGITEKRKEKIYASLINYDKVGNTILKLQNLGFSSNECYKIYNHFKNDMDYVLENNFYLIEVEIVDFRKVDSVYTSNYGDKNRY